MDPLPLVEFVATGSRLPVTAVAFLTETIMVSANGGMLRIHNLAENKCIGEKTVFEHARIYGILPLKGSEEDRHYRVLVFGAKSWTIVGILIDLETYAVSASIQPVTLIFAVVDWIKAAHWVRTSSTSTRWLVALALAHNQVLVCDAETGLVVGAAECEERSILYAAAFAGDTLDDLLVAAGTVFNQVLVWQFVKGRVERRLVGHEGVIFGVHFSSDRSMLASVSDDRTLRLWSLLSGDSECERVEPRNTLYGHHARVWQCLILEDCIVTASEDGTCRVWQIDDSRSWRTVEYWHQCKKNVWCIATNPEQTLVASGGGDGSLQARPLAKNSRTIEAADSRLVSVPLPPAEALGLENSKDHIRAFAILDHNTAVVATDSGHVLRRTIGTDQFSVSLAVPDLRCYAMAAGAATSASGGGLAAIGLRDGSVAVILAGSKEKPLLACLHSGPVQRLVISTADCPRSFDLFTVDADNDFVLWSRVTVPVSDQQPTWTLKARMALPPDTCFATATVNGCWAAVGNKKGSLLIYTIPANATNSDVDVTFDEHLDYSALLVLQPSMSLPRVHGKLTLGAIAITNVEHQSCTIYTGGRDGMLQTFAVRIDDNASVAATRTASARLTPGRIEQLISSDKQSLLAVTFYRRRLVLIDHFNRTEILSVACAGGANKPWQIYCDAGGLSVGFMQGGELFTYRRQLESEEDAQVPCTRLVDGISSLDIRAADITTTSEGFLLATAGEDCCLRIHHYHKPQGKETTDTLGLLAETRHHASAIRCVAFIPPTSQSTRYLLTAGAGSELRCWRLDISARTNLVDWGAVLPAKPKHKIERDAPRIMDIAILLSAEEHFTFAAAYSDASLRIWHMDLASQQFTCVAQDLGRTHACCILSLSAVTIDSRCLLFSGATNGQLMIWDITSDGADIGPPVLVLSDLHQAGINAVDVRKLDGSRILVISGGDDSSVAISTFAIVDSKLSSSSICRYTDTHASSVQCVGFIDDNVAVSVSTDQRLVAWSIVLDQSLGVHNLKMLQMSCIQVADPSAMSLLSGVVVVAGIGLQIFELL
ncbi:WD repeat-containing protein 6 [Coemansia aciculifera]|uniref:WD repeat-containing protein 6 n=1 Tax=Coemansia aciculifera TaxID=417176 RepID=A0A9W8M326_9FUNG|nr:WD repeat-containing protein 6 [Coemansia aciculifera]